MRSLLVFLTFIVMTGCAASQTDNIALDQPANGWQASHDADHPLVGRWFDSRKGVFTNPDAVRDAALQSDILFLGEKHDHPDHHLLQARFIADAPPGAVVLFEMLDTSQRDAVARVNPDMTDAQIAKTLGWADSGWPDYALYAPVFRATLDNGHDLAIANAVRKRISNVVGNGLKGEDADFIAAWRLDQPFDDKNQASIDTEIDAVHCGFLPGEHIPTMVMAQRLRDAVMAENIKKAAQPGNKRIVIAGNGHIRQDRGIPTLLKQAGDPNITTVAFVEVRKGVNDPLDYALAWYNEDLPFEYILFTPVIDPADPCEKYRHLFKK